MDQYYSFIQKYFVPKNMIFYLLALVFAWGLKYHYSRADSDALSWILGPTAGLVECMSPFHFTAERGQGFVNNSGGIIIAPACAGVNFLILSFCMMVFCGMGRLKTVRNRALWLGLSFLSAYGLTLMVNAIRIVVSIYLYESGIHMGCLTPVRMHRLTGVGIYVLFLYGFYFCIQHLLKRFHSNGNRKERPPIVPSALNRSMKTALIPLIWYWLLTLFIPLINGGYGKNEDRFIEHCLMVVLACLCMGLGIFFIYLFYLRYEGRIRTKNAHLRINSE